MFKTVNCEIQQVGLSQDGGQFNHYKGYLKTRLEQSSPMRNEFLKMSRGYFDERPDNMLEVTTASTNMVARSKTISLRGRLHCALTSCTKLGVLV